MLNTSLEKLQKDLEPFKHTFDLISDHVVITDPDASIIYANKSVEDQTGYSQEEIIGKNPGKVWGGKMPKEFYQKMWQTIKAEKKTFIGELKNTRKDGTEYWQEIRIFPILDENKNIKFFIGIEPNIEARKKAEAELKQEKNKLEVLLQSIGDGVVAIDRSWNIMVFNKSAENLSGFKKEEVLGRPFRDVIKFYRESDRRENIIFIEEAMVSGKTGFMTNSTVLIRKDGTEIPVGDSAAPIFDEKNDIVGAIIVFRDMTKEKEKNSFKSDFAYASHQLNTPINKTLWLLESIEGETDLSKIKDKIYLSYQSALSAKKLSEQMLFITLIDQKEIIPKYEKNKLSELLGEMYEYAANFKKDIRFLIEPLTNDLFIETDHKLFRGFLREVIENAFKYNKNNGEINIKSEITENQLLITIKDTGIGIIPEQQALIFTKFFRGTNFNTTDIVGAGLGLFISESYIKLLKGKIWFRSVPDEGTTFFILLPINKA